jgi:hypothetical protein
MEFVVANSKCDPIGFSPVVCVVLIHDQHVTSPAVCAVVVEVEISLLPDVAFTQNAAK